jgi:hypothetical protein
MTRTAAIWLLDMPFATSVATSRSRRVSCPGPAPGRPASGRGRADSPRANAMASAGSIALPLANAALYSVPGKTARAASSAAS